MYINVYLFNMTQCDSLEARWNNKTTGFMFRCWLVQLGFLSSFYLPLRGIFFKPLSWKSVLIIFSNTSLRTRSQRDCDRHNLNVVIISPRAAGGSDGIVVAKLKSCLRPRSHSPWSESEWSEQRVEPTLSMRILSPSPGLLWAEAPLPPLSSSSWRWRCLCSRSRDSSWYWLFLSASSSFWS